MRVAIATVQVPFIRAGAEMLASGLQEALVESGHEADIISIPFRFEPISEVKRAMEIWQSEDLEQLHGRVPDVVVCLRFPTYYLSHPNKVAWLAHQHRAAYELWGGPYGGGWSKTRQGRVLRAAIVEQDRKSLLACSKVFTISERVSARLREFNAVESTALLHPPRLANRFYSEPAQPYVFCPSRLEDLKRQSLLIEAMSLVKSPVVAVIAGEGGRRPDLQELILRSRLSQRVRLLGSIDDESLLAYYAHSLGVFFGPYDEDYGYVTLEAMLSAKPVITCKDSGGPLSFVMDGDSGYVVDPDPHAVARAIDRLWENPAAAAAMGACARESYGKLGISWAVVVEALLGPSAR